MNPFERTWTEENLPEPSASPSYPSSLPHDIAICMSDEEVETTRIKYSLTPEEFDYIFNLPLFKREYAEWRQRLIAEGNSFKLKLRAMSEEFLPTLHDILHSDTTAPSVKVDAFKYITKVAELEPPKETQGEAQGKQQTRLVISWQDGSGQVAVETTNG
jgi:hypothetical protein